MTQSTRLRHVTTLTYYQPHQLPHAHMPGFGGRKLWTITIVLWHFSIRASARPWFFIFFTGYWIYLKLHELTSFEPYFMKILTIIWFDHPCWKTNDFLIITFEMQNQNYGELVWCNDMWHTSLKSYSWVL